LRNLWLTDIEKFPLAACTFENLSAVSRVDINNAVNRLGLFSGKYFNTGVMLINVELWRQENILVKTIEFIKHNPNLILYPDQDGLNKVIDGNLKVLDDRWNSVIAMDSEIPVLLQNAAIIHFTGSLKPWHKCSDPRREIYWNYLKKSPWSYAYSQRNRSPEERIIEIVTSWIYAIGHKTRQVRKILQSL
jgi:lipopolysaccharide biosynthesis glycosyltransferase